MSSKNLLRIKLLSSLAKVPTRSYEHAAGLDIYSTSPVQIAPGCHAKIKTDLAIEIPNGYVGLVQDRSSMGAIGLKILGGVLDSDYRGEVVVMLFNGNHECFAAPIGSRIAQLLIVPCISPDIEISQELSPSLRGTRGLGSTGK